MTFTIRRGVAVAVLALLLAVAAFAVALAVQRPAESQVVPKTFCYYPGGLNDWKNWNYLPNPAGQCPPGWVKETFD